MTNSHWAGSCRMGERDVPHEPPPPQPPTIQKENPGYTGNPSSTYRPSAFPPVVDPRLRVHGVQNLRVVGEMLSILGVVYHGLCCHCLNRMVHNGFATLGGSAAATRPLVLFAFFWALLICALLISFLFLFSCHAKTPPSFLPSRTATCTLR